MSVLIRIEQYLTSQTEKSNTRAKDVPLWDEIWVKEHKTGLLMKVRIVHKFHVPGLYSEQIKKYETNEDNIVWACQDLGDSRFRWFALYGDAEVDKVVDKISGEDLYLNHHKVNTLYTEQDFTSRG